MYRLLLLLTLLFIWACSRKVSSPQGDTSVPNTTALAAPCIDSTKIRLDAPCPMIYAPVCGCNDKTYSNACIAENSGVLEWEEGDCATCIDKNKIDLDRPCMKIYDPVCGCDSVTYNNICEAEKAGVLKWIEGACGG